MANKLKGKSSAKSTVSALLKGEVTPTDIQSSQDRDDAAEVGADTATYASTIGQDPFTIEALIAFWDGYANKLKELGKPIVSSILVSVRPELTDANTLHLIFDNKIQLERFQEEEKSLVQFLRTSLNNRDINISHEIIEGTAQKVIFSLQDRYNHMVTKNPVVDQLKKRFNMTLD
ncbi:MAG: hypothetical protein LAT76_12815 [Schleiferiaceae bacterium]|nr:hypothetical protein [Schleiferiaceae bacterium]